jgi:hypothetical protein
MASYTGRGKVPKRWAVLVIGAAVAAALSMMAVPAGALTPVRERGEASDQRVATVGPILPPGPGQSIGEPRYTVELVSFKALDESGADWSGSDEVFGLFRSTGGYSVRTAKQGDVDSGNSRAFGSQERCLTRQRVLSGSPDRGWLIAPDGTRWDCDPRGFRHRSDCGSSSSKPTAATRSFPPVSTRTPHRFATRPTTSSGEPSQRTAPASWRVGFDAWATPT